jgi:hypothetical protein
MPIKNVMIESDQVENFAVCCTANLTIEVSDSPVPQLGAV